LPPTFDPPPNRKSNQMLPSDLDRPAGDAPAGADDPTAAPDTATPDRGPAQGGPAVLAPVAVPQPPRQRIPVFAIAIALVAVLAGGALFMSGYSLGRQEATQPGTPATEEEAFQPFWDAYHTILERYAGGEIDRKALIEGAIRGMIESLEDPYSSYLTPEEYRESLQGISSQFEGIGAEIGTVDGSGATSDCVTFGPDCRLVIIAPLDGSPALEAGIKAGDIISAVDGSSIDGLTIDEARDRIRGKKGTTVVLTIVRDGAEPFELSVVRDVITQREVTTRDLAGGTVAYIRLAGFSVSGAKELKSAVAAAVEEGTTKIVLDLRGNPGGFVTAARSVASQFIGSGPIFWQEDARGNQVETDAEEGGAATDPSIELAVLIDRGSASASEIVAGAIQDTGRGIIVGETSFGKGTVQQWTPLDDDNGGFRLTVAKWLTPDKRWIHQVGIEPDVKVDLETAAGDDPILDAALDALDAAEPSAALLAPAA
jgi:carboxyl-terminal processing protease